MKKKLVCIGVIVLVLVLALFVLSACTADTAEYDTELITNGDFESWTESSDGVTADGWSIGGDWDDSEYARISHGDSDPEDVENYYLRIVNSSDSYVWLYQSIDVERREIYVITVNIKVSGSITSDTVDSIRGAYITFLENVDYIFSSTTTPGDSNNGWTTHTFYVRPINTDTLTIALCLGKEGEGETGTVYFDNVSMMMIEESEVPDGVTVTNFRKSTVARYSTDTAGTAFVVCLSILTVVLFVAAYVLVRKFYARDDLFINFDGSNVGGIAVPDYVNKGKRNKRQKQIKRRIPVFKHCIFIAAMIVIGAFLVRLILLLCTYGFGGETTLSADLARYLAENGVWTVYADYSSGTLTNGDIATMSPGTIYILAIVGVIGNSLENTGLSILLRMVNVLADMAVVAMIYFYGRKYAGDKLAIVYASLYALLPVAFIMSGMSNTYETVLIALLLASVITLVEKKYIGTYVLMTFATVLDVRALALAPLMLVYMGYMYYRDDDNLKAFGKNRMIIVFGLIGSLILAYLLTLPVAIENLSDNAFYGFDMIANQMLNTNIFVDNAFSFYGMVTLNQKTSTDAAAILNLLFILVLEIYICSLYFKKRNRQEIILLASYMLAMMATFTLKINFTYLFLSIALGLVYAMVAGEKRMYIIMGGYAVLSMLCVGLIISNSAFLTSTSESSTYVVNFETTGADYIIFSIFTVILSAYYCYVTYNITNTGKVVDIEPLSRPLYKPVASSTRNILGVFKRKRAKTS